ncbi:hypothetical protein LCGC14_0924700 [marine sediment metagenome]|uniref:Uncharacterized protein n=1 Tax=marine sediment metagenome TaxID=412755 RepID=A0A0F9NPT0_9ZZZZ
MPCTTITGIESIADLLVWPTTCSYYFWLEIILALTFLVGWRLYKAEEKRTGNGDFLSSIAVSSLAFTILAFFGTLIQNTGGIPLIQTDILLYMIAITIPLLIIWIFKSGK